MSETEFGPCRCEGCRFEPAPTYLQDGLCAMCVEDGCPAVEAPAATGGRTMPDYLIRVPAEWLDVHGTEAWIDADRLTGHETRSFPVIAELPGDASPDIQYFAKSGIW